MSKRITEKQRKTLPRRAQDLSKEELLLALKKKKECNAKALEIVEGLIEPNVSEGWFLDVLKHINQSHLQDVTEERALSRLCGYPLCSNVISSITSQQYRISTKLNKVYDIQERKNFCCNRCFKACKFIKDQMYISPLWLRDVEPSIQFVLLPSSDLRGCSGDEVNVQVERITRQEVNNLSKDKSLNFKDEEVETHREEKSLEDLLHSLKQIESIQESNLKDVLRAESSHGHNNHSEVTDTIENTILIEEQSAVSSEDQKDPLSCVKDSERCNSTEKIVKHEGNIAVLQCKEEDTKSLPEAQMADSHLDKGVRDSKEFSDKKDVSWNEKSSNNSRCEKNDGKQLEILMLASICETDSSKTSPFVTDDNRFCSGNVICSPAETRDTSQEDLKVETNLPSSCSSSYFTSITEYQPNCTSDKVVSTGCNNHFLSGNQCSTPTHRMKGELEKIQSKAKLLPSNEKFSQTVARVEKCLQDWFTMETMIYLYGEQALKDMLKLKGECIQAHYKALSSITWDPEKQERFLTICKRLNLIEIQESGYDIQVTRDSLDTKRKPLPNYDALKKEAESIELKVNAFYLGKMEINERKVSFAKDVKAESSVGDDYEPQLPLVHLHSQRTLRKRIVLDGLNRVLPDFLRTLGMRPSVLSSSVRNLISTFALSPTNITFKPQEWSLLGLVVIKILSLREPELKLCLHQEQSNTYLTLILMSYNLEPGYLDQLLSWLTDIDNLLQKSSGSKA